jgi:hypothetical protein
MADFDVFAQAFGVDTTQKAAFNVVRLDNTVDNEANQLESWGVTSSEARAMREMRAADEAAYVAKKEECFNKWNPRRR